MAEISSVTLIMVFTFAILSRIIVDVWGKTIEVVLEGWCRMNLRRPTDALLFAFTITGVFALIYYYFEEKIKETRLKDQLAL